MSQEGSEPGNPIASDDHVLPIFGLRIERRKPTLNPLMLKFIEMKTHIFKEKVEFNTQTHMHTYIYKNLF